MDLCNGVKKSLGADMVPFGKGVGAFQYSVACRSARIVSEVSSQPTLADWCFFCQVISFAVYFSQIMD